MGRSRLDVSNSSSVRRRIPENYCGPSMLGQQTLVQSLLARTVRGDSSYIQGYHRTVRGTALISRDIIGQSGPKSEEIVHSSVLRHLYTARHLNIYTNCLTSHYQSTQNIGESKILAEKSDRL